ncbi:MAG: MotA/TolQ/ExbB proton channel family protein [Lachnospiraceae bacterium]|nr:MotA/TolQ/ExbB proton channel family protein [Lachnospiraceae bacterium]
MNALLAFIDQYIIHIIFILAFGVLAGLVVCAVLLNNQKRALEERYAGGSIRTVVNPANLETKHEHYATITREEIGGQRQKFNKYVSGYGVCTQLISVLPLMGILGTVAGLILNVNAQDMDAVFASLRTALDSTLWALFFAIVLKLVDAFATSRFIFQIEALFEDFDRRFRDAIDMGNFHE